MSQMREITTAAIVPTSNSNSNSSPKLINGFRERMPTKNESVTEQQTIDATKNDRNNNNNNNNDVMKSSISSKIPTTKLRSTKLNNNALNRDSSDKNNENKKISTSHDIAGDQQPLTGVESVAAGNASHKLTIASSRTIGKIDGKGQHDADAAVEIASVDRNGTLNDDIVSLTQPKVQFKSRSVGGIATHHNNEMDPKVKLKPATKTNGSGKKTVITNAIDTIDSNTGAACYTQQPEQETVISMNKSNERTASNLKKYTNNNDKQIINVINNGQNDVFDKHQNNCDNCVEKCVSHNDMNVMIRGGDDGDGDGDGDGNGDKMNDSAASDMYSDNFDDDPYAELQSYLEKVKREINEVFEQRKLNGSQTVSHEQFDQFGQQQHRIAANYGIATHDSIANLKNSLHLPLAIDHSANIRQTNDWANAILKDLDDLVLSNKRYTDRISLENVTNSNTNAITTQSSPASPTSPTSSHKRSTIINVVLRKTTPVSSPTTSHAPANKLNDTIKNRAAIVNDSKTDNNNILKPEKHTYIPLQSFNLESPTFTRRTLTTRLNKNDGSGSLVNKQKMNQFDFVPSDDSNNLPVLKIEEDFEDISMTNGTCKTISTQTSPINGRNTNQNNRKGSDNSLWTSDESILRCGETVDEDNKSTSSSACDETGGGISSCKSDSSGLDNAESGIGTATPPKDQETWRQFKSSSKSKPPNVIQSQKNWVRHENVMTQTSQTDESNIHSVAGCDDDMDHLEVLSLCEGIADDYDIIEDDYLSDDRKLDKSIDTTSSCTKSSSAERDDDSDIVSIRNRSNDNRAPSSLYRNLSHEANRLHTTSLPIHNSNKSLNGSHTTKSESGSSSSGASSNVISRLLHSSRRPFALHLNNEPFHNILELPSPSSASLHSGHSNITMQELTTKSNSAPILLKNERKRDDFIGQPINLRYSRSQSDRYLAEIEAIEACKWLRAAGFPQYAQMYEDLQFPIDLSNVAKDHPFLENDPLQSLYRRLVALNRCATMRLDGAHKHGSNNKEESEDDEYALSENWTFEQKNRRWSRVGEMEIEKTIEKMGITLDTSRESSPENNEHPNDEQLGFSTLPSGVSFSQSQDEPVRLRRTGSERLKDGAKAFLRRVESIKSRRRKRQNRDGIVISGPQALDLSQINRKMNDLKGISIVTKSTPPSPAPSSPYKTILTNNKLAAALNSNELKVITTNYSNTNELLSPNLLSPRHCIALQSNGYLQGRHNSQSNRTSPIHFFAHNNPGLTKDLRAAGEDSSSYCSDASQESSTGGGLTSTIPKKRPSRTRRFLQKGSKVEDIGALSDSECHQMFTRNRRYYRDSSNQLTVTNNNNSINNKNNNNNDDDTTAPEVKMSKFSRGGSLNLGKESQKFKESFKTRSFRSRSSARIKPDGEFDTKTRTRSSVVRWHSFQNAERPDFIFKKCPSKEKESSHFESGMSLASMSCGQLQVVRKLALVTLTGYMERYCPTHRSGWNWELPKFIKKIKTPDYKDKKVFGVPLVLLLQRTGQTIPTSIQTALKWLKLNALDQVGLFRKSGVKSRILKLKEVIEESQGDVMETYDLQQAYDVADMLKQYFRELPDTLLTAKMSDTFIAIFQHLPPEVHFDAVQSAILLLPDEHREVLQYLLDFLHNVASHAMLNQMTSNNLAVCLAPSLFNGTFTAAPPRSTSVSPRRRKPTGMPDSRELTETRASHDCLTFMIEHCRKLFAISHEKVQRCNFNYMDESKPVPLEALGEGLPVHDWRGYLYECTSATIKEWRERSRGWISVTAFDPFVEVAHKKVGDGHPLRLWRCTTDIESTPSEILNFIFKERRHWDPYLMKCRIVEQLDDHSEIFQFSTGGHAITDYCVLRSWRADLPRGACVIVETSVAHSDAHLLLGGVRGVVLASRYLIEPTGNGKSKIMHLARVDTKGRSPEWYNKCYGHICSQYLSKIRSAFKHHSINSDGKP